MMKVFSNISKMPQLKTPCALTIGMFDGGHLGHQKILKTLRKKAELSGLTVVLTFKTFPANFFHSEKKKAIFPLEQRLLFLEEQGVDIVLLLNFTKKIAALDYKQFLLSLQEKIPFSHLILGKGATFGKDRKGTASSLKSFGKEQNFKISCLSHVTHEEEKLSSSRIRQAIEKGHFSSLKKFLGKNFSLYITSMRMKNILSPTEGFYKGKIQKSSQKELPVTFFLKKETDGFLLKNFSKKQKPPFFLIFEERLKN